MKSQMTMEEAAVYLGVTVNTVFNYRRKGALEQVPGESMVTGASVQRLKNAMDVLKGNAQEAKEEVAA